MDIFKIHKYERLPAVIALAAILILQYLIISRFFFLFTDYSEQSWNVFIRNFHMSGYDPITYSVVTDWGLYYDILRHPLLPFFVYPLYLLNQLLWWITGANCVQLTVGALLVFCSFYSVIFLYRIIHDIIGIDSKVATLLSLFFMGFAHVIVAMIVPDHFCLSLFLMLSTIYIAGLKIKKGETFSWKEAALIFVLTAGVTLSNGVMVFLAVLFVNRRKNINLIYLIRAFVIPTVFLFAVALISDNEVKPYSVNTSEQIDSQFKDTDNKVSRAEVVIENLFGESIQLHRKYVLGDVLVKRPVIVRYTWTIQYAVETVIVLGLIVGFWLGRKQRIVWLMMSILVFTFLLHIALGFGINEVYIMSAHWVYIIPIAVACIFKAATRKYKICLFGMLCTMTAYLWLYHGFLLYNYLTWPVKA